MDRPGDPPQIAHFFGAQQTYESFNLNNVSQSYLIITGSANNRQFPFSLLAVRMEGSGRKGSRIKLSPISQCQMSNVNVDLG
jgi:hypothetical protein